MNRHWNKIALLLGSTFLLAACQPAGPDLADLQTLRDPSSGIEIISSHIKTVSPIDEQRSLYDINGTFKYRDGRYQFLTTFGNIKIYTPLNGDEKNSFDAIVVAQEGDDQNWLIEMETLPRFAGDKKDQYLSHQALFANSVEHLPGIYTHQDGSRFALNDKTLDKRIKNLISEYETQLQKNLALDKDLKTIDEALALHYKKQEEESRKRLKEMPEIGDEVENLKSYVEKQLAADEKYQHLLQEREGYLLELQSLQQSMPALWRVDQCYESDYRFHGRICHQVMSINRDYLPKIRFQYRPDAALYQVN
ncbi:hypothetical protein [Ignatzschineria cameli]|uniref:Lipoprotein n=1 Tax=Ignatzschineria cameli TaxID=2182793 RepID=A0A2U2ARS5_9GAMM|nr:hypothetical protein [Ignatzschineria cameli]PWD86757.1 hypothetical protein DC080_03775 [Ignatzschineria cameli]PWD86889.1 hypothetical protein DC077_03485 [Ignatzschineria cameli]PWD91862.1 hypothetical protein DC079_00420 [Ignatzschineria cameli]PWD93551.1 hypothetical protein DC081_01765 [Ignatzschineria cameli]PWD94293.1 hypothetical protein DC078_01765 [Ignatzschineria cameli]